MRLANYDNVILVSDFNGEPDYAVMKKFCPTYDCREIKG